MTPAEKKSPGIRRAGEKIRVLVADDHVTVLEGLSAIVGRQPDMVVVAQASNGQEAVELWAKHHPDVTLLDLQMPVLDGVRALEELRQRDPSVRVLMLTTFDTEHDISRAIRAGAKGYLLKDAPREQLLDCIRKVHAGGTFLAPAVVAKLASELSSEPLTGREREVLSLLAAGRSNKEISTNLFISETTVKSHLRGIFAKLNVLSRTEAIAVASRRGLVQR
ncbi:DNA-binding response regulator [Opitutaceae bacterium EW11]|nr:DNA-binding response regulator [Opitutaceae bacterium EW11]